MVSIKCYLFIYFVNKRKEEEQKAQYYNQRKLSIHEFNQRFLFKYRESTKYTKLKTN